MGATAYPSFGGALPGHGGSTHTAPASAPVADPQDTLHASAGAPAPGPLAALARRCGPLALVIGLHLVLGYAVVSGLATRVIAVAMPKAVNVVIIATPTPKQEAAPPKVVEIAPLTPPAVEPPPIPFVQIAPSERAITLPPPAPSAPVQSAKPVSAPVLASAPPPAPASNTPRTITSGVEYLKKPEPVYPPMSRRLGEQGKVVLRVLINESGIADKVTIEKSSGFPRLDEAARQAVQRALFKPYMEEGRAVPAFANVPLDFTLG